MFVFSSLSKSQLLQAALTDKHQSSRMLIVRNNNNSNTMSTVPSNEDHYDLAEILKLFSLLSKHWLGSHCKMRVRYSIITFIMLNLPLLRMTDRRFIESS